MSFSLFSLTLCPLTLFLTLCLTVYLSNRKRWWSTREKEKNTTMACVSLHQLNQMKTINLSAAHLECLFFHVSLSVSLFNYSFAAACISAIIFVYAFFLDLAPRCLWPTINTLFTSARNEQVHSHFQTKSSRLFFPSRLSLQLQDNLLDISV